MKIGDIVKIRDLGVRSGNLALIVGVRKTKMAGVSWEVFDIIEGGERHDGIDSTFLTPLFPGASLDETG